MATLSTLSYMAELARNAGMSAEFRYAATSLIQSMYASDKIDFARSVEIFTRGAITLIDEPDEVLVDPMEMLRLINQGSAFGDCDDVAMFAAALLVSMGIRTRFKAVNRAPEGHYTHVFVEYQTKPEEPWRPMDPTFDGIPFYPSGNYITVQVY